MNDKLTKEQILQAPSRLDELLRERGVNGELCIFGDAAMVLSYNARESTRDVDAIFIPKKELLDCARQVSQEMNFELNWLNDGVIGFVSPDGPITSAGVTVFRF